MMAIDQALFSSAQTDRLEGYQVTAASEGVSAEEARDIAAWAPSHDSLHDARPGAASVNFHPLRSGRWCVSKTQGEGEEYSGRGGRLVSTRCLIAAESDLARFGNNPFRLLQAAEVSGRLGAAAERPERLASLTLLGRAQPIDRSLIAQAAAHWGARRLAAMLEAALASDLLWLICEREAERAVAALMSLLPVERRSEFSFTTGLKPSPRRPFRVVAMPPDEALVGAAQRRSGGAAFDLRAEPAQDPTGPGWPARVFEAISTRQYGLLASSPAG